MNLVWLVRPLQFIITHSPISLNPRLNVIRNPHLEKQTCDLNLVDDGCLLYLIYYLIFINWCNNVILKLSTNLHKFVRVSNIHGINLLYRITFNGLFSLCILSPMLSRIFYYLEDRRGIDIDRHEGCPKNLARRVVIKRLKRLRGNLNTF